MVVIVVVIVRREREREREMGYIILLGSVYYFNDLYGKIEIGI